MIKWYVLPAAQSLAPGSSKLFFDDEHRNYETESLGVTMQIVPSGTDRKLFNEGLNLWRKRRGIKVEA